MVNSHWERNQRHQSSGSRQQRIEEGNSQQATKDGYRAVVVGYGNMLMCVKKYSKAKELFEEYLKNNSDVSEVSSLLQKCEDVLRRLDKLSQIIEKAI